MPNLSDIILKIIKNFSFFTAKSVFKKIHTFNYAVNDAEKSSFSIIEIEFLFLSKIKIQKNAA